MISRKVYLSPGNDLIIYSPGSSSNWSAAFMGAFYYSAHGMHKSFFYGLLYYAAYIGFGLTGHDHTATTVIFSAVFWRSVWHYLKFESTYDESLRSAGFKRLAIHDRDVNELIDSYREKGYVYRFLSAQAFALLNPART
jgi:hypothetical protein